MFALNCGLKITIKKQFIWVMQNELSIKDNNRAIKYLMGGEFYHPIEKPQMNGIKYIGQYSNKILLLVNESMNPSISELLQKIMKFAGCQETDYALVTRDDWGNIPIEQVVNIFRPKKIIAWGQTLFPMLPIFSNEEFEGIQVVTCISLSDLEKNSDAKKSLAAALKTLMK